MNKKSFIFVIVSFLILTVGCEKPTKVEIIWGEVVSINGHYKDSSYEPVDCRIVSEFEEIKIIAVYAISYDNWGPTNQFDYNECRRALLLKEGDRVFAIKRTWASKYITYELNP